MSDSGFGYFETQEFRRRFTAMHRKMCSGRMDALYQHQVPDLLGCSADLWRAFLLAKAEDGLVGVKTLKGDLVAVHAPRSSCSIWRLDQSRQQGFQGRQKVQSRKRRH